MITFKKLGLYGRLGNQLFQYSILLAVGNRNGYTIKIPNYEGNVWHGQRCLLGNFNISADFWGENDKIEYNYIEPTDQNFSFNSNVFEVKDNTNFHGFFQNYKYYKDDVDLIKKELSLKDEIIERNLETLMKIREENRGYEIVSLHLRRGDSNLNMYGGEKLLENSLWYKYFNEAKKEFLDKKIKFLIFTGGNRYSDNSSGDYNWCRNNFIGDEYLFVDGDRSSINDFSLMQLCDHHILSPISSFSWWVGFLNNHKNKIIVAPEKYYFLENKMDNNFYPPNINLK